MLEAAAVLPAGSAEAEELGREGSSSVNDEVPAAEGTGWDACSIPERGH